MKPPEKPLPQDCCGTGCVRCVYDIYVEQLKEYKAWKKKQKVAEKSTEQENNA
ncbi:MAG TPA: oxidoreductase-like domain-containing protein [Balneolales bacterium]|nr:oxidoreductase-like domain-containing protein [Balneolales bacterium]